MEYEIGEGESVSTAVVRAVSAVDGRKPCHIPPLVRTVEPDALDALFATRSNGEPRTGGHLSFVYNHCQVTVDHDEYLTIRPLECVPRGTGNRDSRHPGLRR